MKLISNFINEKLIIHKDSKLSLNIDIKGETNFTYKELDEIYALVQKYSNINPIVITNVLPTDLDYKGYQKPYKNEIYIIYIHKPGKREMESYININKIGEHSYELVCALYGYIFSPYEEDRFKEGTEIREIFSQNKNIPEFYKKIEIHYN